MRCAGHAPCKAPCFPVGYVKGAGQTLLQVLPPLLLSMKSNLGLMVCPSFDQNSDPLLQIPSCVESQLDRPLLSSHLGQLSDLGRRCYTVLRLGLGGPGGGPHPPGPRRPAPGAGLGAPAGPALRLPGAVRTPAPTTTTRSLGGNRASLRARQL